MKRLSTISIIFIAIIFVIYVPNTFAKSVKPAKEGIVDLLEKDLWGNGVINGASGKLKFNNEGSNFDFNFVGNGLEPDTTYALVRSFEPATSLPYSLEVLAEDQSDSSGLLLMVGSYNLDIDLISAEFLLIPVEMLDRLTNGRPSPPGRYLSGQGIIGYDDTDTDLKCGCQASGTSFDEVGITIGEKAVDFTLKSTTDEGFSLYEFLGKENKPLVLIFGAYT